ncbi:hypothetical protein [Chryseobacterium sp. POE27]|uniref:hypothetical protein n=1 Tax=Chryseobacterium sp. POE27 TaxID=3138177 RepID=UPI00321ADE46
MKQDHIIQKVFVEITVNNKEKAYCIKDDINSFLSIDVFPEIEKYINGIEQKLAGHTLQIPPDGTESGSKKQLAEYRIKR